MVETNQKVDREPTPGQKVRRWPLIRSYREEANLDESRCTRRPRPHGRRWEAGGWRQSLSLARDNIPALALDQGGKRPLQHTKILVNTRTTGAWRERLVAAVPSYEQPRVPLSHAAARLLSHTHTYFPYTTLATQSGASYLQTIYTHTLCRRSLWLALGTCNIIVERDVDTSYRNSEVRERDSECRTYLL